MAKKKLKKALKNIAKVAIPAAAIAGLMGRRKQNKTFLAEEGGARSILPKAKRFVNVAGKMAFPVDVNANPREISDMIKSYGFNTSKKNFGLPMPQETGAMMLSEVGDYMPMKKGGRAKKTKFSKNKKKQANRSRKK